MKPILFAAIVMLFGSATFNPAHARSVEVLQICDGDYKIVGILGILNVQSPEGEIEAIETDSEQTAHTASFQIVWDANPNALGGAVMFPNDAESEALNCEIAE